MKNVYFNRAIGQAIAEEMRRDDTVFVTGLDQAAGGGAFFTVSDIAKEFGRERVVDVPISEEAFTGMSVGAAATGLRPITEIQFNDWLTIASDQMVNQAAFMKYMFGGGFKMPMVVHGCCGGYYSAGPQHSKMLESWFALIPGIKVIVPSTPWDVKGLMKSAIRDNNLVLLLWHKKLLATRGDVSDDPEYLIPIGKADVKKEGSDVTIVTYSYQVLQAMKVAEKLEKEGISVEVVDLRTIKPMDTETICASVKKTGRVICLQETWLTCSVMSEVAAVIAESGISLKKPLKRIGAKEAPIAFAKTLEQYILPSEQDIEDAVRDLMK